MIQGHYSSKGMNAKQSGKKIQGARQNNTMGNNRSQAHSTVADNQHYAYTK